MKKLILVTALAMCSNLFATEVKLGMALTSQGEALTDYTVKEAVFTSTQSTSGLTLAIPGCYSSRQRTGQSFPYRYEYQPYLASNSTLGTVVENVVSFDDIGSIIQATKAQFREVRNFWCRSTLSNSIHLKLNISGVEHTYNAVMNVEQETGKKRLYVLDPVTGKRSYLGSDEVNFVLIK